MKIGGLEDYAVFSKKTALKLTLSVILVCKRKAEPWL
jgi:hypothetical protein